MNQSIAITTMLISRDHILRLGVQNVLAARRHICLISPLDGTIETEETLAREQPQVIMIDSDPETDLSGLIHKMKRLAPKGKIVLLAGLERTAWKWEAFSSAVDGIVLKMQPPEALIACIENLCAIPAAPPPLSDGAIEKSAVNGAAKPSETPARYSQKDALTEREREIIALVGQGLSNKDIADRLRISGITVRHHLTSIFDKLGVATRQKLLIRAHQYGLVDFTVLT